MGKVTGFMEFARLAQAHEPVAQRKTHFREFITPLSQQEAKQQAQHRRGAVQILHHRITRLSGAASGAAFRCRIRRR